MIARTQMSSSKVTPIPLYMIVRSSLLHHTRPPKRSVKLKFPRSLTKSYLIKAGYDIRAVRLQ